ncbi:hypothetical protein HZS_4378, partial [Henneguya salminicola]
INFANLIENIKRGCSKCESQLCPVKLIKKEDNITVKGEHKYNQTLNIQYLNSETAPTQSTTFVAYILFKEIGFFENIASMLVNKIHQATNHTSNENIEQRKPIFQKVLVW